MNECGECLEYKDDWCLFYDMHVLDETESCENFNPKEAEK